MSVASIVLAVRDDGTGCLMLTAPIVGAAKFLTPLAETSKDAALTWVAIPVPDRYEPGQFVRMIQSEHIAERTGIDYPQKKNRGPGA